MKKLKISRENIIEISELLDMNLRCYYNPETEEIKAVPDYLNEAYYDSDAWEEEFEDIESNLDKLIQFELMPSNKSFEIMEEFIDLVKDRILKEHLISALNRKKPFSNFKYVIDNSGDYRQKWFDFKNAKYIEWVEYQVEEKNR